MRSPFPGMDPHLENPGRWAGVHDGLITGIRADLNRKLGPGYVADIGTSVYIIGPAERRAALAGGLYTERVVRQEELAAALGSSAVPSSVIGHVLVEGVQPCPVLRAALTATRTAGR